MVGCAYQSRIEKTNEMANEYGEEYVNRIAANLPMESRAKIEAYAKRERELRQPRKCFRCERDVMLAESVWTNGMIGIMTAPPNPSPIPLKFGDEYWFMGASLFGGSLADILGFGSSDVIGLHIQCLFDAYVDGAIPFDLNREIERDLFA